MVFGNAFRPRPKTRLDFGLGGMERRQTSAFPHRFRRAVQGNECRDLKGSLHPGKTRKAAIERGG